MELIPAIDMIDGRCVRLRQGDYDQKTVFSEDPVAVAQAWADQGATRIHLVDLDGAKAGSIQNGEIVRKITSTVGVPCQLGGGIRDTDCVRYVLEDLGIDRAIIGTQALKQPEWFSEVAHQFPQRLALGLDAKDSMVATAGWLDVSTTPAIDLARQFQSAPLGAIIYTNIANDGMMQGVDERTLEDMKELGRLGLPVIASGGVTKLNDIENLLAVEKEVPQVSSAIIGRALYEGTIELPAALELVSNS